MALYQGVARAFTRLIDNSVLHCFGHVFWSAVEFQTTMFTEHVMAAFFDVIFFFHISFG
tara:strand:- start:280 stop:456 length:177 start_codon:yes stop_codon:yes gene_type:complete